MRNASGDSEMPIVWKYYQYLSLLFVEIYLERFFRDPQALAIELNAQITRYNDGKPDAAKLPLLDTGRDAALGLNKLALWCATGSGKTLLMHMNLRQYQHYLAKAGGKHQLNRILLLTPNEGLSTQHMKEFAGRRHRGGTFDKNGPGLFSGKAVEIIEISKLADEMGDKRVAVDAFENNNLVLVDEGHRGSPAAARRCLVEPTRPAVRKGLFLRVFGYLQAGSERRRHPHQALCAQHRLRLLLPLFL